jgi:histidine triad (HIT) family protein
MSKTVFAKIIDRELPADILFENERIIVIKDIHPDAPIHLLGITKHPYTSIHDLLLSNDDGSDLLWELMHTLAEIAVEQGIAESGYRFVTNVGPDAHQVVPHLHVHLLGGEKLQMKDPTPKENA